MKINGFTPMTKKEKESTYGGWQWLVAMVPLLLHSIVTTIVSIKAVSSEKGSIKTKEISSDWDNSKKGSSSSSSSKGDTGPKTVNYYVY